MRTKRIELEGNAGSVAIERQPGDRTIRIDSIIRDAKPGQQTWKTWELDAGISDEDLFKVATDLQQRSDGGAGSNSMIHELFHEMQRFQD